MSNPPSIDLANVQIPLTAARSAVSEFTLKELKDELTRRGCVDFSKWEVAIKMGPWLVLILAFTLLKLSETLDGTLLACFLK